jgi:hypothetical protein
LLAGAFDLQRFAASALVALMAFVAVVLVARRLAGALRTPLPWLALFAIGMALAATAVAVDRLWPSGRSRASLLKMALPIALSLTISVALSLPDAGWALLLLWAPPLVVQTAWHARAWSRGLTTHPLTTHHSPLGFPENATANPAAGDVVQHFVRSISADGRETIAGAVCANFAAGQRTANVHIAFCPPLAAVPELEFEQTEGPAARVRLGQALAHGARLEVRLEEPARESERVWIEFRAAAPTR